MLYGEFEAFMWILTCAIEVNKQDRAAIKSADFKLTIPVFRILNICSNNTTFSGIKVDVGWDGEPESWNPGAFILLIHGDSSPFEGGLRGMTSGSYTLTTYS